MRRLPFLLRAGLALTLVCVFGGGTSAFASKPGRHAKLDRKLNDRASNGGTSRVIVIMKPGWTADSEATRLGGRLGRRLGLINGRVLELSNAQLQKLADHPGVERIVHDRPIGGEMNRVALTVGARDVQHNLGVTGAGIGVAVIDSGVASWHDDLSYQGASKLVQTSGGQRVARFVDFVGGQTTPYDDNGHGTHVSGIIAGNGYDTRGARAGIAPDAHLVSLRVLDRNSRGVISNVIAALDYAVANKALYNIRVINLSVGAAVTESYNTDPLTLAAKRAVDAGIVVVTAAGNLGKNARGQTQYGAITAPGNAPWVLTVGASSHQGTINRADDVIAGYSSRGPSAIDFQAKPDVVAPGTGSVSLSSPGSHFYVTRPLALLTGSLDLVSDAVPEPERHEHGGAGRCGQRRADAAGEPEPDAEPRQGHHPVHRAVVLGLQRVDRGRRIPEHEGGRRARAVLPHGEARRFVSVGQALEQDHHLGQPPPPRRRHSADRHGMGRERSVGRVGRQRG